MRNVSGPGEALRESEEEVGSRSYESSQGHAT
jgi:hypothetical protein